MMMILNAETKNDDGFERRNWEAMMALNAEIEKRWWLWTPMKMVEFWLWTPMKMMALDSTHGSLALKAYQQNLYFKYYY